MNQRIYFTNVRYNKRTPPKAEVLSDTDCLLIENLAMKWHHNSNKKYISKTNAINLEQVMQHLVTKYKIEDYKRLEISQDEYRFIVKVFDHSLKQLLIFNSVEKFSCF